MNGHSYLSPGKAEEFVEEWSALHPKPRISTSLRANQTLSNLVVLAPLELPEEFAVQLLLLGVVHSSSGHFAEAQLFLNDALERSQAAENKWIGVVCNFELAVLEMRAMQSKAKLRNSRVEWAPSLAAAEMRLEAAMQLCSNADMASRLESRINMLRNEISSKRDSLQ